MKNSYNLCDDLKFLRTVELISGLDKEASGISQSVGLRESCIYYGGTQCVISMVSEDKITFREIGCYYDVYVNINKYERNKRQKL